ncbi:nardilysin-like protein [Phytophthora infestans T30-4]|uniref:Nardilysin-like protein n=1 Tax=Phytophthora infestans (strain T30-4) TaxID=403677 RepID=D0NUU6_PHYIT|nr:nardilysin-like protein [Phytophthora infestans T30-4]EEY65469.1 nardilysin-like protein [Phytophthora infestans T30-4]|eukprot:XP_002897098.1 nardilysin-like protein [Phytophthora infestans T30-4]
MSSLLPFRMSLDSFRSPADKKSYRLVTTSNGMEVLLIRSDARPDFQGTANCNDVNEDETNDRVQPMAAACLTVGVGSLADPEKLPGLAHYLEHMMFMGSENYPDEDAFESFLSAHGGSSNGATECESTRFVFDVDAAYLAPALDMFGSLFVAPLLRCEAMERELKAVESEFQRVRNNNPVRLQQVMCETSIAKHPYSRCFTWGNEESLKRHPERDGIAVREQMLQFFKKFYVGPAMKLCVYGCESLDVLEQYVTQSFNGIPLYRSNYDVPRPETLMVPYGGGAGQKPTVLRVIPVGEKLSLRLYWMLPPMMKNYRQKPWLYVGRLLGHEGPESTASILKRRQWATDVIAGTSDRDGYEFGSFGSVFEVRVSLTERGLASWQQVAQVIFDALRIFSVMATTGDLPAWVFDELRSSSEMDFRFQEEDNAPVDLCRELSERMLPRHTIQRNCKGDLLRYDLIQGIFDASSVCALLSSLSADNVRIVLMASSFTDTIKFEKLRTERWFGTKYTVDPIPDTVITAWSRLSEESIELSPLPTPNPFMPRDISLLPWEPLVQADSGAPPDLILTTSTIQLWYKRDRTFLVPKASVSFLMTLPEPTAVTHMLAELHVELVRRRLQHTLEHAETANFTTELGVRDQAIEVVISGFSDTLPELILVIMREILCPSTTLEIASELTLARDELEREYRNSTLSPRAKAYELRLQMLESSAVTTDDKLEALQSRYRRENELADDLADFTTTALGCTDTPMLRCLVIGNLSREASISLARDVEAVKVGESTYEPEPELEPEPPILAPRCHTIALPPTTNGLLVRRKSERAGERNSVVEVYFQIGKVGPTDRAYAVLLRALLAQPLFHELRTKQQLGYTVTCSIRDTHDVLGLSVAVQSASHAAGAVAKKLDLFLHEEFPHEFLLLDKCISPKRFAAHVQTLQRAYARPDLTLTEEGERYWEEIVSGRLEFDLDARVTAALRNCTRQGLLERYRCWVQGSTSCCTTCTQYHRKDHYEPSKSRGARKLRVHVVGQGSPLKPLEQLVPPDKTLVIITGDLVDFKRELRCHCHVDE